MTIYIVEEKNPDQVKRIRNVVSLDRYEDGSILLVTREKEVTTNHVFSYVLSLESN